MVCFVPIASPSEIAANDFDAVDRCPSIQTERDRQQHQGDGQLIGQRNFRLYHDGWNQHEEDPSQQGWCRALPLSRARALMRHTQLRRTIALARRTVAPARTIDRTVGG